MSKTETLKISGYRDEAVPHLFFRQEDDADHLAILLPGMRYTSHMPLLFYPDLILRARGADVLRLEYAYDRQAEFQTIDNGEQMRWFLTDVTAAYQAGLTQRSYRRVTLIGKSLGTLAMGHLLVTQTLPTDVGAIWLTPLLRFDTLRQQIKQFGRRSLFVIGTADPHYDQTYLTEVQQATEGDVTKIKEADHGLMIGNDISRSIRALEQVMQAIEGYLS
jgi:hypothetical protein